MNNRTAIVFGATGLVGSFLLEELVKNAEYKKILVFSRRKLSFSNSKIELIIDDLESLKKIEDKIKGDDIFCCLGTTIKTAGSQKAFEKVDLDLPTIIAETAFKNGVKNFAVISSIGANPSGNNFYLRTKGKMEEAVLKKGFEHIVILRPSLLTGPRNEKRTAETMSKYIMKLVNPLLIGNIRKYRSIQAKDVAKAMLKLVLNPQNKSIFESDEIQKIANH